MVNVEKELLPSAMNARIIGSGTGTCIILGHGFGTDQSLWDKVIPGLAEHSRVLVFDWSFSGSVKDKNLFHPAKHSSFDGFADDLITLMEEMKLGPSVFVGHSLAGMVGCRASVKRPDLFKKLILLCASPRYINGEDYEGGFKESEIDDIISKIESNFHDWASTFAPSTVDSFDPLSAHKFEKSLKQMRPEVALSLAKTVFYSDERHVLEKVQIPCTIIQTTKDPVVPISVPHCMQKKIKGESTVEIIDSKGHFPQITAHEQLLDVLGRVLGFREEE